jgi:hypothetical protein
VAREGRLLLRTGDRDAEQVVVLRWRARAGIGRDGTQDLLDLPLAQRFAVDAVPADRLGVRRQQLHRADAVAADRLEQREGAGAARTEAVVSRSRILSLSGRLSK